MSLPEPELPPLPEITSSHPIWRAVYAWEKSSGKLRGLLRSSRSYAKASLAAQRDRVIELEAALRTVRVFVQDSLDTSHDRGTVGNLMSARDCIDSALKEGG